MRRSAPLRARSLRLLGGRKFSVLGKYPHMNALIEVRPFRGQAEYEQMIDYFLNAEDSTLHAMGVERARLPKRADWIASALRDHARPSHEKERAYLAWVYDGVAIGHSSINKIRVGEEAFIHLHLWSPAHRQAGLGTTFFQLAAERFARDFALRRLYCEPYAENPAPNRILPKAGFRFVKRYRTIPGPLNYEQDVNQYVREFFPPPAPNQTLARVRRSNRQRHLPANTCTTQ
jgi:RimJ/RimL family protein N-acetyltransferase